MRLGIADVGRWLSQLDPAVLDGWLAYDRLEPISSDWQHSGTIAAATHNAAAIFAAAQGVKIELRGPEEFTPQRQAGPGKRKQTASSRPMTGDEVQAVMAGYISRLAGG